MEYNQALAQDLAFKLKNETKASYALLKARSMCIDMLIDIKKFEAKNKPTAKTAERSKRVHDLMDLLDEVLKIDDYNYQLRVTLSACERQIEHMEHELVKQQKMKKDIEKWETES